MEQLLLSMENGTVSPQEQLFHFSLYFIKNQTFQRRPKELVWNKGLKGKCSQVYLLFANVPILMFPVHMRLMMK